MIEVRKFKAFRGTMAITDEGVTSYVTADWVYLSAVDTWECAVGYVDGDKCKIFDDFDADKTHDKARGYA